MVAVRQEQAAIRDEVSRLTKLLTGGGSVPQWQPPPAAPATLPAPKVTPAGATSKGSGLLATPATPLRSTGSVLAQAGRGGVGPLPAFPTPGAAASRGMRGAGPAR